MPKKVELTEAVLQLAEELKRRGIDTNEMEEHIRKSSVIIAKQLNRLLENEDRVEINGEVISITLSGRQPSLDTTSILHLERERADLPPSDFGTTA